MECSNGPWRDVVWEEPDFTVYNDGYPVTQGHLLFVPREDDAELVGKCLTEAYKHGQELVLSGYCDGFNVGVNHGASAGQTVMYPHVHLIPRRSGDMEDPRGGVRHVIPEKGNYKKDTQTTDYVGDVVYGDGC